MDLAASISLIVFLGVNKGLLGDEDSVEELTLILAADSADLLDLGAGEGNSGDVSTIEDKLTLDISRYGNLGVASALDEFVLLTTKEVLDGDVLAILGDDNVDGEMSVYKSHLVAEALFTSKESLPVSIIINKKEVKEIARNSRKYRNWGRGLDRP